MKPGRPLRIALVGTNSLRGQEMKKLLERRNWPLKSVELYDTNVEEEFSQLSEFKGEPKVIHSLDPLSLEGNDLVFLSSDEESSRAVGDRADRLKYLCLDLNGTFNEDASVPLIVAGVNDSGLEKTSSGRIANPQPATIILSHLLHAVHKKFGLLRGLGFIIEPASVFELDGIEELAGQSVAMLNSETLPKDVFSQQLAFNLLCRNEDPDLYESSSFESRLATEIRRVLDMPELPLSLSLIQAPIFHTYSMMSFVELASPADVKKLQLLFDASPFFERQTPAPACLTSSVAAAGEATILIGRIQPDTGFKNSFWIWAVADNLTRGSAVNALEIAEKVFSLPG